MSTDIKSISFTTFGWDTLTAEENVLAWYSENSSLVERYFDIPPDFDDWDADAIRSDMFEYLEAPTHASELPDALSYIDQAALATQQELTPLDVECFLIGNAKCVHVLTRHRVSDVVGYSATIFLLFSDRFWTVGIGVNDPDFAGEREERLLGSCSISSNWVTLRTRRLILMTRHGIGIIPRENDALSKIRKLASGLRESIVLGAEVLNLEPFQPPQD